MFPNTKITFCKQTAWAALLLLCWQSSFAVNDNILAHDLFQQGEYAKAAEIFTDPAWKGVALYRSQQWWRAAEAFVRAEDAVSQYNLGNCYVMLGYYELALDAYLRALSIDSAFTDAEHNANVMRQLLALQSQDESAQQSLQSRRQEIDRIQTENETQSGASQSGEDQSQPSQSESDAETETPNNIDPSSQASDTNGGGNKTEDTADTPSGEAGADSVEGMSAEPSEQKSPSGGSQSSADSQDAQSSGVRTALEQTQATEQWLRQINHNAFRFLQLRIELETDRRRAAGQAAPAGGSVW